MRRLSARMLRRRVSRWGWYNSELIVVVFEDGKIAVVDPGAREYYSVRAWRSSRRAMLRALAVHDARGAPLEDVIRQALAVRG